MGDASIGCLYKEVGIMGENNAKFERQGDNIVLTSFTRDDSVKVIYTLAKLTPDQLETIKTLEKTWGVALIAYARG